MFVLRVLVDLRLFDWMELPTLASRGTVVVPRGLYGSGEIAFVPANRTGRFLSWLKLSKRELAPSPAFHSALH